MRNKIFTYGERCSKIEVNLADFIPQYVEGIREMAEDFRNTLHYLKGESAFEQFCTDASRIVVCNLVESKKAVSTNVDNYYDIYAYRVVNPLNDYLMGFIDIYNIIYVTVFGRTEEFKRWKKWD